MGRRILQIGKYYPPYYFGGIETATKTLHEGMRSRGVDNDFLGFLPKTYKHDIEVDEYIYLCKIDIDIFSTPFSLSFIKKWRSIKDIYDIVVISMPHPFTNMVLQFFPPKHAKIVLWWHCDIIKQTTLLMFYKPFLVSLIKKSCAVIAPTNIHIDQSDFAKYMILKKHIIPYSIPSMQVMSYLYTLKDGKYVIFSCGRLIYYKGFHILIDAAEHLPANCVVHIAGVGALHEQLSEQIKIKGLTDKVFLLGHVSDEELEQELQNCFLFCLPSTHRTEMYAIVQVEAFCHGKPVISTNIPRSGVPVVNKDGVTGYTVEVNNPEALSEKIKLLINDKVLYDNFCKNTLLRGKELTDNSTIDKYIELFFNI